MASLHSSLPDGYEQGSYQTPEFTEETLLMYEHGVACVSNVDGRGNVSIYAMIKRGEKKNSKLVFDYANILGFVGGEIRDGFCNTNLKEGEALRFMQTHIDLSKGRTVRMVFAPVEEVSAMFVLPLRVKSLQNGVDFPDPSTETAFEYFKQAAKLCPYQKLEDFFDFKLGKAPRKADRSKFSGHRAELESWWLERSELLYYNCPPPPQPPILNLTKLNEKKKEGKFMSGFMEQASQWRKKQENSEAWKKIAVQKLTDSQNYDRFCGMAILQALWYIWIGDPERAIVMVEAWQDFERDKAAGQFLDANSIVLEELLDLTLGNLSSRGMCIGQTKVDSRLTLKKMCEVCLSPVFLGPDRNGFHVLTCIDKDSNGEFGCKNTRVNIAKLLFAINKYGMNKDFDTAANHSFHEALHIFLEHSFSVLYWRIKPTNPMTADTENEAVPKFIELLTVDEKLDASKWVDSSTAVLREALVNHCSKKLGKEDVDKLTELFRSKLEKILIEYNKEERDSAKQSKEPNLKDVRVDLLRKTVAPTMSQQFKRKWRLMSIAKRKRILLVVDSQRVREACNESYKQMEKIDEEERIKKLNETTTADQQINGSHGGELCTTPGGNEERYDALETADCEENNPGMLLGQKGSSEDSDSDDSLAGTDVTFPEKCSGDSCPCTDSYKFWQHLVSILVSDKNPVPYFKCIDNGELILRGKLWEDQEGHFFDDVITLNEEFIGGAVLPMEDEVFSQCKRLALICKMACHRLIPMLLMGVIHQFGELEKRENVKYECQACQCCGQVEEEPGDFKRCGECKSVFYCGRKCQAQDWKAGHKQICQDLVKDQE